MKYSQHAVSKQIIAAHSKKFSRRSAVSRIIAGIIAMNIIVAAIVMHGSFIVLGSLPADLNNDGKVDWRDLLILAVAYGSDPTKPNWDARADINADGKVDWRDLLELARNYGKTAPFKMGLMVGGDESDLGFSYMAILGAEAIHAKYGWDVSISRLVTYADQRRIAADYAAAGYDLVCCVGGQFMDMMYWWGQTPIPSTYPKTFFAQIPGAFPPQDLPNVVSLHAAFQTVGHYLAGVLAGKMTATNAVAVIFGEWYPYLSMEFYAFKAGVESANPSAKVYCRIVGNWWDASAGKQIATALIETKNVDIIVQVADMAGRGVIAACQELGKMIIGTVADQYSLAPDNTLTSIMMDTPRFMDMIVQSIINDTFLQNMGGQSVDIDLSYLAPFHNFETVVPQSVKDLLAATSAAIIAGTIVVPRTVTTEPPPDPT